MLAVLSGCFGEEEQALERGTFFPSFQGVHGQVWRKLGCSEVGAGRQQSLRRHRRHQLWWQRDVVPMSWQVDSFKELGEKGQMCIYS